MKKKIQPQPNDAWYTIPGLEQDVVVSTRMRLARNLANFPFPIQLESAESQRILSIIFDAFNRIESGDLYHSILVDKMDSTGKKIMCERGILDSLQTENSAILIRNDGKISCTVNMDDHVRLSSFVSGFNFDEVFAMVKTTDDQLQHVVQFAASYDFGYLNTSILDSGSGMKLSVRFHLPALSITGKIPSLAMELAEKHINLTSSFGPGSMESVCGLPLTGTSLGEFYDISTKYSTEGTEFDQIANISSVCRKIIEMEKNARQELNSNLSSTVKNFMYRAVFLARSSVFVSKKEAIEIISGVKLGKNLRLLTGTDDATLCALLYRIQEGHLEYVLSNGKFNFEKDVAENRQKQIDRLRALLLQEAFEDIKLSV